MESREHLYRSLKAPEDDEEEITASLAATHEVSMGTAEVVAFVRAGWHFHIYSKKTIVSSHRQNVI